MTDSEIAYLKACLAAGLMVLHHCGTGLVKVISIGPAPALTPEAIAMGEVPEPTDVAYLELRTHAFGTPYAALSACGREDFIVTTQDLAKWPD